MVEFAESFIYWALTAILSVVVYPYVFVRTIISKAIEYFSFVYKLGHKAYNKHIRWEDYISIMDFIKALCFFVGNWVVSDE